MKNTGILLFSALISLFALGRDSPGAGSIIRIGAAATGTPAGTVETYLASMPGEGVGDIPGRRYAFMSELPSHVSGTSDGRSYESAEDRTVHVGVIPRDNPRIAYEKYQPIIDYLSEHTPYAFELALKKTYADTVNALGKGETDLAFLSPLTYLHAHSEFRVTPMVRGLTDKGIPTYRSVIVTREDRALEQLADLKAKDFAFAALQSTSGNLIPRYLLADEGIHLNELGSYENFNYHDTVVKWVLKGKYDAGAVRESVAEKYLPLGLKFITVSDPMPTGPVAVGPAASPEMAESVRTALLEMNKTEEGERVLQSSDPEFRGGFIPAADADYDNIRTMINSVPSGCGLHCHPKIKL